MLLLALVYTTKACAAPVHVYTLGQELHLDVSNPQGPVLINNLFALLSLFLEMNRFS